MLRSQIRVVLATAEAPSSRRSQYSRLLPPCPLSPPILGGKRGKDCARVNTSPKRPRRFGVAAPPSPGDCRWPIRVAPKLLAQSYPLGEEGDRASGEGGRRGPPAPPIPRAAAVA